ncbi:RNA polymerase sigma-70 factor (ECF subfamily) [Caulobacter ginsengisoli]|uniref:RNA polymerase sigma-70 factor (ECF subfamily) n=1 Tax=Caulobacter ginsengisoli TaxID=400775 RepID=A0ABU0IT20_9CAUL|nr:sigma-70 family RNA polymerase sigma factor [Caulobacter ginsengisoli]MDQ0465161.1 RNA polymerase sigma-70 factor (ECF subfamily) [Caulobacter ginsengisoli]
MTADTVFEARRGAMTGLAYRMLGSRAEAEDVVQDAWLRWRKVEAQTVREPGAFLNRVVTRLCLDRLKAARARREVYVGEWLPEPVLDAEALAPDETDLDAELSVAFLLTLERLSPLERAAFLLHDVFDRPFSEVAAALDRSEAACRQLAARARTHVRQDRPQGRLGARPDPEAERRLTEAFMTAALTGDADGLKAILTQDVVMHADGGGVVSANLNPIFGVEKAIRLIEGVLRKFPPPEGVTPRLARVNGMPGIVLVHPDGTVHQTMALEIAGDRIAAVYTVRNPDKLAGLSLQ